MAASDRCAVLKRFPTADGSLMVKCYCQRGGHRSFYVPDYFEGDLVPPGSFEPFNLLTVHFEERNTLAVVLDISDLLEVSLKISRNFERFTFMSKVSLSVLKFVSGPEREVLELFERSLKVESFFEFNLIRFWLNLATVLGFSLEKLSKPGWVNLSTLGGCKEEEKKNPYCVYLSPREFSLLKRVSDPKTGPFRVGKRNLEGLEGFFTKFFTLQKENF